MNNYPHQAWYIACTSQELKQNTPIQRTINHIPLVIFRSQNHQIIAFLDKCPHRHIPLSSGYIHNQHLVCPYHGWEFDNHGICQQQPGNICYQNQPKHNLTKYPAIELYHHIWIYLTPDVTPPTAPYQLPYINQPGFSTFYWKMISQATLENIAENFLDATHTHFVHRGLIRKPQKRQEVTVKITRSQQFVEAIYLGEQQISGLIYQILAPGCHQVTSIGRFILPSIAQLEYQTNRPDYRLFISLILTPIKDNLTQGYIFVTFRWGLANWLGKLIARPLFILAAQQDKKILNLQAINMQQFPPQNFVITEIDIIKPHIDYLLKSSLNPSPPSNHHPDLNWEKTIKIML